MKVLMWMDESSVYLVREKRILWDETKESYLGQKYE